MEYNLEIKSPYKNPSKEDIDILLIGGIHGDEPSGVYTIQNLRNELVEENLTKTVGLLIANPNAVEQDTRYTEEDLNRLFGKDSLNGTSYERQLANGVTELVNSADSVLSIHSTQSFNEPFGLTSTDMNHHIKRSLFKLSLSKAVVYPEKQHRGSLVQFENVLEIEAGYQKSQSARNNALQIAKEFLVSQYAFKNDIVSLQWSDSMLYQVTGEIPKFGETDLHVENFTRVPAESIYATSSEKEHTSDGTFTPILMSEEGYKSILGYKSKHLGWLSEYV